MLDKSTLSCLPFPLWKMMGTQWSRSIVFLYSELLFQLAKPCDSVLQKLKMIRGEIQIYQTNVSLYSNEWTVLISHSKTLSCCWTYAVIAPLASAGWWMSDWQSCFLRLGNARWTLRPVMTAQLTLAQAIEDHLWPTIVSTSDHFLSKHSLLCYSTTFYWRGERSANSSYSIQFSDSI